eukprot:TRINITY_DN5722_c0_g1_i2.p1 TRINITY_DN5722_c0_g1~~TRINITY_DN5722_c0_g1_i2.p1  ORF type:complete len:392 (-),score=83.83 TRINITY_DN5722_c0_g1_i2:11-1096(-)
MSDKINYYHLAITKNLDLILLLGFNWGYKILLVEKANDDVNNYKELKMKELHSNRCGPIGNISISQNVDMVSLVGYQDHSLLNTRSCVLMRIEDQPIVENNIIKEDDEVIGKKMHQIPIHSTNFCEKENLFCVVLQNSIVLYKLPNLQKEITTFNIDINEKQPVYSVSENGAILAYLSPNNILKKNYQTVLVKTLTEKKLSTIEINVLSCSYLKLNKNGKLLAVFDEGSYQVHVYTLDISTCKYEETFIFNKSKTRSQVNDVSFSHDDLLLSVCSDSGTTHIFQLVDENKKSNYGYSIAYPGSCVQLKRESIPIKCSFSSDNERFYTISEDNQISISFLDIKRNAYLKFVEVESFISKSIL